MNHGPKFQVDISQLGCTNASPEFDIGLDIGVETLNFSKVVCILMVNFRFTVHVGRGRIHL